MFIDLTVDTVQLRSAADRLAEVAESLRRHAADQGRCAVPPAGLGPDPIGTEVRLAAERRVRQAAEAARALADRLSTMGTALGATAAQFDAADGSVRYGS